MNRNCENCYHFKSKPTPGLEETSTTYYCEIDYGRASPNNKCRHKEEYYAR